MLLSEPDLVSTMMFLVWLT